jgi:hypothetical protein
MTLSCARTVPEPYLICPLGLAFERKQMPQVNENTENRTKRKEALERWHVLRRQMLYPTELRAHPREILNHLSLKRARFRCA